MPESPRLDARIESWRSALAHSGLTDPARVDELEDHLRCLLEELPAPADEAAFDAVVRSLGPPERLATEFAKESPAMHPLLKIVGLVATLGFLLAFASSTGSGASFVQVTAAVAVTGLVGLGLLTGFGPRRTARALGAALRSSDALHPSERAALDRVLARGQRLAWASGGLTATIGVVQVLANLADPAQLGTGLGVALLAVLYGGLLAELGFGTLRAWLADVVADDQSSAGITTTS